MALTTKNHQRKITATHKKRQGLHHKRNEHYSKAYWPYLPVLAIVTAGLIFSSVWTNSHRDVLGYATDMSAGALLSGTNSQRAANGLGALALNATLSQAAQAKAADMAAKDYWSHTSPDGSTPWTFISASGYSYQTAGENLAYGFTTSGATITGWMNSAPHRENIVNGSFQEVGFGIVNSPNYQGSGPQTIVVAMYAQPYAPPVATPTPSTPTPVASAAPVSTSAGGQSSKATSNSAPAAETTAPEATVQSTPEKTATKTVAATSDAPAKAVAEMPSKDISRLQTLSSSNASWTQFAVSMIASVTLLIFLLRHSFAWHKMLVKGEKFILKHPTWDLVLTLVIVGGFILTRTSGLIK